VFVPVDPLDGAKEFTIEILFSPAEAGGGAALFPPPGYDRRAMARDDRDAPRWERPLVSRLYVGSPKGGTTQIEPKNTHATNAWYWAAVRYDGKILSHFVNGAKELETRT